VATFGQPQNPQANPLTVNLLGAGYQLMAMLGDGTQSEPSDFFSVVPRVVKFVQTAFPNPAGFPNEAINPPPQVAVFYQTGTDASGQPTLTPDASFSGEINVSLGQNPTGATLKSNPALSASGLVFTGLTFSLPSGPGNPGYTLVPSDGNANDKGIASPPLVIVTHDVSFDRAFEPSSAVVSQASSQIIVVNVLDLNGNVDNAYTGNVVLTLTGPGAGSVLPMTAQAVNGRAHFVQPIIGTPGSFEFTAHTDEPGSAPAISAPFQVSPANPTSPPAPVSQTLSSSKSVVTAGQTVNVTDVLTLSGTSAMAVGLVPALVAPSRAAKGPKPKTGPTGVVLFEDGSTVLQRVKLKVVRGLAEAKAKLKLTMLGVQTINAVYVPDAQSQKLGLSARTASTQVTVLPAPPKGKRKR
jgi:hypothetical protein